MPIAAAKLEKQASTEAAESIKQAIVIIEHKIRNLEKRKKKIETYREDQSKGQILNSDQLFAVSKCEEVIKTLEFAQDLCKQFQVISVETSKLSKKQMRKEALERATQDSAKIRGILIVQDILQYMGQETIREDFLAGRNGAIQLTEEDLKFLDELYIEVSPKRGSDEGLPPFQDQVTAAADHLLSIVECKEKDTVGLGTTYEYLNGLITKIQASGYFDQCATQQQPEEESPQQVSTSAMLTEVAEVLSVEFKPKVEIVASDIIEGTSFVAVVQAPMPAAPLANCLPIPSNLVTQPPPGMPSQPSVVDMASAENAYFTTADTANFANRIPHRTVSELIQTVAGSFNFLQDSELDAPCIDTTVPSGGAPTVALPLASIPTQTFTNQSFTPALPTTAVAPQSQQVIYQVPVTELTQTIPGFAAGAAPNPPPPIPMPPSHRTSPYSGVQQPTPTNTYQPPTDYQQDQQQNVEAMHSLHAESWALADPNCDAPINTGTEWIPHSTEQQPEWTQESQPAWGINNDDPNVTGTGFTTQVNARPYSGNRGNRGNRGSGSSGRGASPNLSYSPRSGGRGGTGGGGHYQQNGNNRNNASYTNYGRNNENHSGGGTAANNGSYYQQQNGYQSQQRESFPNNGNYGGQGQYRPRGSQRGPGARGGSARGGGMTNDGNTMNNQRTGRGGASYAGRPQNNRQ